MMKSDFYFLATSLVLLACLSICSSEPSDENVGVNHLNSARERFTLPKLFDFTRYKQIFQKSYNSLIEEIARQKLFLARVFQVVISMVRYKHSILNYHLSVNHMSDLSPDELKRRKTTAEQLRSKRPLLRNEKKVENVDVGELHVADEDEIEQVVEEVIQHKNEPGYKEIAYEFERAQEARGQVRKKRGATQNRRREISMDDLIHPMKQDPLKRKASIPSNNPAYEPPELTSYGAEALPKIQLLSYDLFDTINKIPGVQYLKSMVLSATDELADKESEEKKSEVVDAIILLEDEVFIDHRKSNCFMEARDQGDCGSCWVFATISMFEWLLCNQTGKKEAFSEQYVLDCSKDEYEVSGCDGGAYDMASQFGFDYGLQLLKDYPYVAADDVCPYEDMSHASYIKLEDTELIDVELSSMEEVLERTPILMNILVNSEFLYYGSGVHTINDCTPESAHSMLMVGSGRQDNEEYFLFRNSHSSSWGEDGYYKLSKESFKKCVADELGGEVIAKFDSIPTRAN